MKIGDHIKPPLDTTNVALAMALNVLGAGWFSDEKGRPMGVTNDYTADTFREIDRQREQSRQPALNLAAKTPEDAVRIALANGIPGKVSYHFAQSPIVEEILAGWDGQSKLLADADAAPSDNQRPIGDPLEVSPEAAARICCQYAKARREFHGAKGVKPYWMRVPARFVTSTITTTTRQGEAGPEHTMRGKYRSTEVSLR